MKKYLFNRVLRSIFSIIMVMLLSIVLIFSLYPLQKIIEEDADIESTKRAQGEDATKVKTLEVLEYYGYTNYVSIEDYCVEVTGDNNGPLYKTCINRSDTNEHKQNYLKKYRDLGWEEITLKEYTFKGEGKRTNADVVTRAIVNRGDYTITPGQEFKQIERLRTIDGEKNSFNKYEEELMESKLFGELTVPEDKLIKLNISSSEDKQTLSSFKLKSGTNEYSFDGTIKNQSGSIIYGTSIIPSNEEVEIVIDLKLSQIPFGDIEIYFGSSDTSGNFRIEASVVEKYIGENEDDFLYESDGKTVVTYNNIVYFQKRRNPFSIFWSWISNVINLDTKNTVESYVQYDPETEKFLTESDSYEFEFGYYTGKNLDKYNSETMEYLTKESDSDLDYTQLTIQNADLTENTFLSIAGIKTKVDVESGLTIKNAVVNKVYKNSENHEEGGSLAIEVTFSDGSKENITKDVRAFLQYDIPVYVGDDNVWYFGNTRTSKMYNETIKDWGNRGKLLDIQRELNLIEFMPAADLRGYKVQLDEYGAPALTCRGCKHKYTIYFDNAFPYIHFNFVNFSLGESIFFDKGKDVLNLLFDNQGEILTEDIVFPNGETKEASISSFHTCTFNGNEALNQHLYVDNYTKCSNIQTESSMIATSFIIGIFATLIAYFIGVPVGVLMSRFKDRIFDKVAMVYIIIMFSVPSLAYIYFFQVIATGLFDIEVVYKYGDISTYILPIVSLSLGSIASMMMWTRRYMIDQGNSDYVKFARAKGLSESQIFFKHTLRNAIVPIAHGVPGSIIGAVAGALVTEEIYNVPGTGKLMVTAIKQYDNWIAIGLICFYSVLGIISMILGDIVITLVDPRISFVDTGGRK